MRALPMFAVAVLGSGLVAACDDSVSIDVLPECNPLGGTGCLDPWPSSVYLRDDPSSPTGVRLDFPKGAFPKTRRNVDLDPTAFNKRTGFSPATQIIATFAGGVAPANLPPWTDYGASLAATSPTVLLDMSTGDRVAHFAEVDVNDMAPHDDQAVYIRPAARLKGGTRYAVAFLSSLKRADGQALESPPGFKALRDGTPTSNTRLEAIRVRTDEVFDALEGAGISRKDLVLAWDFVTADDTSILADTLAARDAALAAMGSHGANLGYTIDSDDPTLADDPNIARRVLFHFDVPRVLAGDALEGFARDGDGKPMVNGMTTAAGVAVVPTCATAANKAPILIFGHGFFGDTGEAQSDHLRQVAAKLCMVVVASEWRGMSNDDIADAAAALNNPNFGIGFGERIVQGIIDFMALGQLARGKLATDLLVSADPAAPGSIVDPTRVYFYGISQGGILGSTLFALDPELTRGVIHVGAGEWSLLFERSRHWTAFGAILKNAYRTLLDTVLVQQFLQMAFDPSDPVHAIAELAKGAPLPGTPAKTWLFQESDGDPAVSNLATELLMRTFGLPVLAPSVRVPYALDEAPGPVDSGLAIFTERPNPPRDPSNKLDASEGNDAHDVLRFRPAVTDQMKAFLGPDGKVVNTCGAAACDCAAGACGPLP